MVIWTIVFSHEVAGWYQGLTPRGAQVTDRILARLEAQGHLMRMPHSRSLGEGLYELRFICEGNSRRISYVLDLERQAITLTTFRKQKTNERREILRARRAQREHLEGRQR